MYELSKFDSVDEYIESVREHSGGTSFEGFADVLEDHRNVLKYYFQNSDEITSDFIGTKESLFRQGVEVDGEKLEDLLDEDAFSAVESYKYARDLNQFLLNVAEERTDSWDEFVSDMLEARDILSDNREEAKEIFDEIQEDTRENLIEEKEMMIELYANMDDSSPVAQLEREKALIERMTTEEIYKKAREDEIETCESQIGIYEWREENRADIGDYIVYDAHIENNRDLEEFDIELTPNTVYKVILKVTGVEMNEIGEEMVSFYQVQPVAFDSEILDVWPEHFVMQDEAVIPPQEQESVTVYEENPMGSVETKVLDSDDAENIFAFSGHGDH